jgi:hypothetical protein
MTKRTVPSDLKPVRGRCARGVTCGRRRGDGMTASSENPTVLACQRSGATPWSAGYNPEWLVRSLRRHRESGNEIHLTRRGPACARIYQVRRFDPIVVGDSKRTEEPRDLDPRRLHGRGWRHCAFDVLSVCANAGKATKPDARLQQLHDFQHGRSGTMIVNRAAATSHAPTLRQPIVSALAARIPAPR